MVSDIFFGGNSKICKPPSWSVMIAMFCKDIYWMYLDYILSWLQHEFVCPAVRCAGACGLHFRRIEDGHATTGGCRVECAVCRTECHSHRHKMPAAACHWSGWQHHHHPHVQSTVGRRSENKRWVNRVVVAVRSTVPQKVVQYTLRKLPPPAKLCNQYDITVCRFSLNTVSEI